jgi:hypothetical protein
VTEASNIAHAQENHGVKSSQQKAGKGNKKTGGNKNLIRKGK